MGALPAPRRRRGARRLVITVQQEDPRDSVKGPRTHIDHGGGFHSAAPATPRAPSTEFLTVTTDLLGRSFVYTLPLVDTPAAADLTVFHQYGFGELPDGIAFGASGLLYVAMATPTASGVSILSPNGAEQVRLANPAGSPVLPYDSPANIAFNNAGSILLSNHAFVTGVLNPEAFNVLDVFVDDTASPLEKPLLP